MDGRFLLIGINNNNNNATNYAYLIRVVNHLQYQWKVVETGAHPPHAR